MEETLTAAQRVALARQAQRPGICAFIDGLFTGFFEMKGDRLAGEDGAILGGVALYHGQPVTVIGTRKGRTVEENLRCRFGMPGPEGYRKALRLMKQAEKFGRPVVCFVDTCGARCGVGAEERGQGQAIAENLMELATLCVPVISVLIGEGGSGGALALAMADRVWMLENAVYSVISPEGCASILWKDASRAEEAANSLRLTAEDAKTLGVVERTLSEEGIGEPAFYDHLRSALYDELKLLAADPELLQKRYNRFRNLGNPEKVDYDWADA